jgi:hypothetical protein
VSDDGEPRRTIIAWYRSAVLDEAAPDDIFIDLDTERAGYLLGNFPAAEAEVSPLHLDNRVNIRPLGHLKRQQLIQRWFELGDELGGESIEEVEIGYKVLEVERTINTVLGRKLLPSYPVFVLSLLQILESGKSLNTITGSYGYIYETLIASALAKEGGSETLDTKFTYLAYVAYRMFKTGRRHLSEDALEEIARDYFDRYKVRISLGKILPELIDSQ